MRFRYSHKVSIFPHNLRFNHHCHQSQFFNSFLKKVQTASQARASFSSSSSSNSQGSAGSTSLLPGATVATILMLGALQARRLYEDKKIEEAHKKGNELEFQPDVKATFLRVLPLCSISRFWGSLTSIELPVWLRSYVYKAWARAFHSNLEEVALPLEEYASLGEFFVRALKEGCRPIDPDPHCLVSPVDGTILRCGELKGSGAMIEQVKGLSYSVSSLLGASSFLPMIGESDVCDESSEQHSNLGESSQKSWWRISLASPKVRNTVSARPTKGLYYCVIYLKPGDYHRIHSPVEWNVIVRRHFSGLWQEGFMAIAAIGATNIGSIELFIEPELRTNLPRKKLLNSKHAEEQVYEPEGVGKILKKGDEVAAFNMGSTVVLVFQAPTIEPLKNNEPSSEFRFNIRRGDRVRVGEALGRWHNL